jgi:predicted transglutaminase-like cysteine proteinase
MFQKKTLRGLSLAAGLWLTAPAALAAPQPGPDMIFGVNTAAPAGFLRFCAETPSECASAPAALVREIAASALAQRADQPAISPTSIRWDALLTSRQAEPQTSGGSAPIDWARALGVPDAEPALEVSSEQLSEPQSVRPEMSRGFSKLLAKVNSRINRAVRRGSDFGIYGSDDVWAMPLETKLGSGDCEDYVLEKRRALLKAGVPASALSIAIVDTPQGETHAVLLVATTRGEYVLDNLSPWVTRWNDTGYSWRMRQAPGRPFEWVEVQGGHLEWSKMLASARDGRQAG